jgi:hypothetical protein
MIRHEITWTEPSPLWSEATTGATATAAAEFHRPAILRFTTDSFMDEFLNVLATDPLRLGEYRARPETWRGFVTPSKLPEKPAKAFALPLQRLALSRKRIAEAERGVALPTTPPPSVAPPEQPLKLYQPAHQRYYLVTSCLVCENAGLPDRKVDPAKQERVSFVIRRLFPPALKGDAPVKEWDEYAWVPGAGGDFWQMLKDGDEGADSQFRPIADDEERIPLFALNFAEGDQRKRRLFAGLVPVGKRDAYLGAAAGPPGASGPPTSAKTSRKILLRKEVIEPWKQLIERARKTRVTLIEKVDGNPTPDKANLLKIEREQIQTASWYLLLDLARYLRDYIPNVHQRIVGQAPNPPLNSAQQSLVNTLDAIAVGSNLAAELRRGSNITNVAISLSNALKRIGVHEAKLEKVDVPYRRDGPENSDWPDFLFPVADPSENFSGEAPLPPAASRANLTQDEQEELDLAQASSDTDPSPERVDTLAVLIVRALPLERPAAEPAVPPASVAPKDAINGWFRIRCLYERPACGPLQDDRVSDPTEPFQLAGFFDPDAPARPIRIGLPLDTTPAGLRKFDKQTALVISDTLCGQLKRLKGITFGDLVRAVLPWPLHKDLSADSGPCKKGAGGPSFGMICSVSIPIINLCALVLLIIMVTLLDAIFRWLPYFIICFPIPGLKAKE